MDIIDGMTLTENQRLDFDVCIIGTGAAGITLAHRLQRTGKRIVLLESSRQNIRNAQASEQLEIVQKYETTPTDFGAASPHTNDCTVDQGCMKGHRFCDPSVQPLYRGEVVGPMATLDPNFLTRSRIRVFGGSTNCWGGWTRTLSPFDFRRRDLSPVYEWPIDLGQLLPFYKEALTYCSLGTFDPLDYDRPDWWNGRATAAVEPMPTRMPTGTGALQTGVFTIMYGPPPNDGALDFQIVWGPRLGSNVTMIRNANVRALVPFGQGVGVATAQPIDPSSHLPRPGQFGIVAKQYVLAAGGIETVRLLLLSKPGGLGNSAGQLGRAFMIHPLNGNAGKLTLTDKIPFAVRTFYSGYPRLLQPAQTPPQIVAGLMPTPETMQQQRIGNFRAFVDISIGGNGNINLNWEQMPNPDSTISLSPTRRDCFGDPEVRLDWRMSEIDARTASKALELVKDEMVKLKYATGGSGNNPIIQQAGDHHMGATRMSANPAAGYVDRNCRAHEVPNLYIASSSVFATGGVANPTLTIIALAVRLADHLATL